MSATPHPEQQSAALVISGTITVDPAHVDRALEAARDVTAVSRAEPGCLSYGFWADPESPGRLRVFEEWASAAALQDHLASPHLAEFREALDAIVVRERDITRYEVAASSPL
jgi:quinol monooxygenase YgiN